MLHLRINIEFCSISYWCNFILILCDYSCRKEISEIKDGGLEIVEEGPLRVSVKVYIDV